MRVREETTGEDGTGPSTHTHTCLDRPGAQGGPLRSSLGCEESSCLAVEGTGAWTRVAPPRSTVGTVAPKEWRYMGKWIGTHPSGTVPAIDMGESGARYRNPHGVDTRSPPVESTEVDRSLPRSLGGVGRRRDTPSEAGQTARMDRAGSNVMRASSVFRNSARIPSHASSQQRLTQAHSEVSSE